jgi:hypothetical protein
MVAMGYTRWTMIQLGIVRFQLIKVGFFHLIGFIETCDDGIVHVFVTLFMLGAMSYVRLPNLDHRK